MESSEQKQSSVTLAVILIFILASILFYLWVEGEGKRSLQSRAAFDYAGNPVQTLKSHGQMVLPLGKKVITDDYGFVYRGVRGSLIIIDLYILDLDAEQPYEQSFTKNQAKKEMVLGGRSFRLLSADAANLIILPLQKK